MHRYQGEDNVPNWICFGTRDQELCKREYDKYMYRIIGVTDEGQIYLLKETFLKEGNETGFAWNREYIIQSGITGSCPDGNCPEWNKSDLFQRINGTANGTISGSGGKDDKADTDIFVDNEYYDYLKSGDENGGEEASEWYNLIDNHDWYYGDTTEKDNLYNGNYMYNIETGKSETSHYVYTYYNSPGNNDIHSETYTWTNTVNAKISLMYLHDVLYAYLGGNPESSTNVKNSWIFFQKDGYNPTDNFVAPAEYLSTRQSLYPPGMYMYMSVWYVYGDGSFSYVNKMYYGLGARPVFYVSNKATIASGEGTQESPYTLNF